MTPQIIFIIYASAVSFWEISLKFSLRKLELQGFTPDDLSKLSIQMGFRLLPVLPDECATCHHLTYKIHRDPFDRMLIWQAIKLKYILITKDSKVSIYDNIGLQVFW